MKLKYENKWTWEEQIVEEDSQDVELSYVYMHENTSIVS